MCNCLVFSSPSDTSPLQVRHGPTLGQYDGVLAPWSQQHLDGLHGFLVQEARCWLVPFFMESECVALPSTRQAQCPSDNPCFGF